ncbi:invasion associated locus B family protein [Siculibacillus lacustris]|nr:invasion associated locus B family protein [Siculibacillus lacustris]
MTVTGANSVGRPTRLLIAASMGAAATLLALGAASAQSSDAAGTDAWIKLCRTDDKTKKELCKTAYDLRTPSGQFLASVAVVEASGEARKIVEFIMPTALLLQPGLKVQIDQGKTDEAKFGMCAPDGCVAQLVGNDAYVASLKKGTSLTVTAFGQASNPVTFTFPLGSYKSASEGKPIDAAALKKREEAIAAEVQQKQKSIEDQLRDEQRKAQQSKP